jgi:hypothetical protein
MSHAAHPSDFTAADAHAEAAAAHPDLSPANIDPPANTRSLGTIFLAIGAVGLAATIAGAFVAGPGAVKHALAAYQIGVLGCLAICLGATFWVLVFHLTQAGWSVTLRRQFENIMTLAPIFGALMLPVLIIELLRVSGVNEQAMLFTWMHKAVHHDPLFEAKAVWFNPLFFFFRALIYILAWTYITRRLYWYSTEQDRTGDKWLTNRARFTSAWGMLVFALTTAFAAFDWIMSMDYRFFSTMWGVYFFAGAAFSSVPVVVLIFAWLRRHDKMVGLVTREHAHDLGKLMFGFTVFWAYIGFSQYFLIWYANIPEETQFMIVRKLGFWRGVAILLVVGHFILPFYIMLWLFIRRSFRTLSVMAVWMLLMHFLDHFWIVRPFVYAQEIGPYLAEITAGATVTHDPVHAARLWLDVAGIVGVLGIFGGLLMWRIASGPLTATRDPRMPEALHHRNYV